MKQTQSLPGSVRLTHRGTPLEIRPGLKFKLGSGIYEITSFAANPNGTTHSRTTHYASQLDGDTQVLKIQDYLLECQLVYCERDAQSHIPEVGLPNQKCQAWATEVAAWMTRKEKPANPAA